MCKLYSVLERADPHPEIVKFVTSVHRTSSRIHPEPKSCLIGNGSPILIFDSIASGPLMAAQPDFPTPQQVEKASKEQLAKWYRFLLGTTPEQRKTLVRVKERLNELGGMTPELSKKIGH